jgi:hypothetical protein
MEPGVFAQVSMIASISPVIATGTGGRCRRSRGRVGVVSMLRGKGWASSAPVRRRAREDALAQLCNLVVQVGVGILRRVVRGLSELAQVERFHQCIS